ncbi:unnamed protein product [Triticum turgidum subsp. durum]|uniref:SOSEKI DIX-like domain-containing protein n=1 Tax=Triticum turgidum subsp. durum TaxID=4567 RepID=A0A9R1QN27_TRITD|nr:unnamed protein product [Triticum turgidum subsp. durum]
MEGRARRRASPSRTRTKAVRVEPEPPPTTKRHGPGMRAAVVYYLCRSHHLEHPHFMEVTLASPQGLYLRDVIGWLDALRGKGMVAKYSWSCKRSYKTGFVWHDLSVDDLLLLTQGTEYVLKGSEFPFDESKPLPMPGATRLDSCGTICLWMICCCSRKEQSTFSRAPSSHSTSQSLCQCQSEDPRRAMEGRARRRASPSGMRTKAVRVEPEPPPTTKRHGPGMRAAVVYHLCRSHHLEHPHFMEVTLASPQGLYLRDVIGRLDALRGKGMVAKYSWSCKRSYKTGFVWHDLSVDDLLLLTQGTEYVLKGSEFPFDESKPLPMPDHQQNNAVCAKVQPCEPARQQESPCSPGSSNQGWTSKSPSPTPTTYPTVPVIKEEVPPPPPTTARAAVVPAIKEHAVPPRLPQLISPSTPCASTIGE